MHWLIMNYHYNLSSREIIKKVNSKMKGQTLQTEAPKLQKKFNVSLYLATFLKSLK